MTPAEEKNKLEISGLSPFSVLRGIPAASLPMSASVLSVILNHTVQLKPFLMDGKFHSYGYSSALSLEGSIPAKSREADTGVF